MKKIIVIDTDFINRIKGVRIPLSDLLAFQGKEQPVQTGEEITRQFVCLMLSEKWKDRPNSFFVSSCSMDPQTNCILAMVVSPEFKETGERDPIEIVDL